MSHDFAQQGNATAIFIGFPIGAQASGGTLCRLRTAIITAPIEHGAVAIARLEKKILIDQFSVFLISFLLSFNICIYNEIFASIDRVVKYILLTLSC